MFFSEYFYVFIEMVSKESAESGPREKGWEAGGETEHRI